MDRIDCHEENTSMGLQFVHLDRVCMLICKKERSSTVKDYSFFRRVHIYIIEALREKQIHIYIIEALREKQIGPNVVYILIITSQLIFLQKRYCTSLISEELLFMSNRDNNPQFFSMVFRPMHTSSTN